MTTPPSRFPGPRAAEGEVLRVVALLGAEGGEEEAQVRLVAPEDGSPPETEAMVLTFPPDKALVVCVARGLDIYILFIEF